MRTNADSALLSRTMPKTKRLTVRELRNIAKELKNADLDVVQQVVVREVQKEQHVHFFIYAFLFGLPTNLKIATCDAISGGTP